MVLVHRVYQRFQQPQGRDHEVHTIVLHILQIRGVEMGTNPHVPIHHSMFLIAYSIGKKERGFFREIIEWNFYVKIISRNFTSNQIYENFVKIISQNKNGFL